MWLSHVAEDIRFSSTEVRMKVQFNMLFGAPVGEG